MSLEISECDESHGVRALMSSSPPTQMSNPTTIDQKYSDADGGAQAPFLLDQQNREDNKFGDNREHAAARSRKKNRAHHHGRRDRGRGAGFGGSQPGQRQHQGNRNQHLHQAGVMVVVYVGTVDPASHAGLPNPVQFAIRGDALDQSKAGQRSSIHRKDQREAACLGAPKQGLSGEEAQHGRRRNTGAPETAVSCGYARHAEDELRNDEQAKYSHGKKQRIPPDLHFAFQNLLADPQAETGPLSQPPSGRSTRVRPRRRRAGPNRSRPKMPYSRTVPACAARSLRGFAVSAGRAHEIESTRFEGLLPLGREAEIVDPELTTDRTAFRQAPDMQHQQSAIVSGGEFAGGRFPESRLFQFVAVIQHGLGVHILNREMRAASALDFSILIVRRELIGSIGLHRDELTNPRIGDSRSVKGDQQRTMRRRENRWDRASE